MGDHDRLIYQTIESRLTRPGPMPSLEGYDFSARIIPANGISGGDHYFWVDFKQRYDLDSMISDAIRRGMTDVADNLKKLYDKVGMCLVDVSGKDVQDGILWSRFHDTFLGGIPMRLRTEGNVPLEHLEDCNARFANSTTGTDSLSVTYAELNRDGLCKFHSCGANGERVYSRKEREIVELPHFPHDPPMALFHMDNGSERDEAGKISLDLRYHVHDIDMKGRGDLTFFFTDGLADPESGTNLYMPRLQELFREFEDESADRIASELEKDLMTQQRDDDISYIVIKRL
jgi:serine phosphatase RsbU (regulator of sigma subunit)